MKGIGFGLYKSFFNVSIIVILNYSKVSFWAHGAGTWFNKSTCRRIRFISKAGKEEEEQCCASALPVPTWMVFRANGRMVCCHAKNRRISGTALYSSTGGSKLYIALIPNGTKIIWSVWWLFFCIFLYDHFSFQISEQSLCFHLVKLSESCGWPLRRHNPTVLYGECSQPIAPWPRAWCLFLVLSFGLNVFGLMLVTVWYMGVRPGLHSSFSECLHSVGVVQKFWINLPWYLWVITLRVGLVEIHHLSVLSCCNCLVGEQEVMPWVCW